VKSEKITSQALAGNLLGDPAERTVNIVLPPGYATSNKRYPVIYVMPGGEGGPGQFTWGVRTAMASLLDNGEAVEMIVVVPDGTSKLGSSLFRSSPVIGDYETYLTRDVVGYMDTHYRTLPARESRGLGGCSNGGTISMRLALKYPNVFSVVATSGGVYDESLDVWSSDVERVQHVTKVPQDFDALGKWVLAWYIQAAAAYAPDPNNPPFYCEMPVRIVNGHGEFVPEVVAKIVEHDSMHEARRYVQQPVRLNGILIQHWKKDEADMTKSVHNFEQLLTDLGIEHEYVEEDAGHCEGDWATAELKYMADKLVFEK
jgi:enterochelin esterase-like enzyme